MEAPKKIALLGFDCALTHLVRKHIEEGIAPNFKKVFENGTVTENCLVPFPTITPPNWTCMATGAWPGTNNVTDFWRNIPGTTPEGANTHNSFNWDYVESESIWEAAEKVGKKSVILNYPMSYNAHKRLKNGVVVGGASLTPGVFIDTYWLAQEFGEERSPLTPTRYSFCDDTLLTTDTYPGNTVRVDWKPAAGWANVPELGDDPLEFSFAVPFPGSMFKTAHPTWHVLVRDLGNGYDTVTLATEKDFGKSLFTIKTGEWTKRVRSQGLLADGTSKEIHFMAKLISMDSDDASSFRLYLSHALNIDGEYWCYPASKAAGLCDCDGIATNNCGMFALSMGWFDLDMWMEIIGLHYEFLGNCAEKLLGDQTAWDIFYSHAHPTDYIYHVLMTELDPATCTSKAAHEKAWQCHHTLYIHADRYLGRLLALFNDDTLVTLISDHGATPDGPGVDLMDVLTKAGLTANRELNLDMKSLEGIPENVRESFAVLGQTVDPAKSRAIPQRMCYVYVNLKGRDPEGIVDLADYEKTQREIIDALMTYTHPKTGKRPFCLALPKREAMMMGLWGEQCGDVVYAVWPEYSMQHGAILPTSGYGIGDLRTLCVFYGPKLGIKQNFVLKRVCNIVDLVPTYCYLTGWPLPKTVEGSVIYQIMEDMNWRP